MKVLGKKNRKGYTRRINLSLIRISNTRHSTITNSNSSGKVGHTNSNKVVGKSNNMTKRLPNSKLRTTLPKGCGEKKWLSTSKPKGRLKISCVCYVAFVNTKMTRISV